MIMSVRQNVLMLHPQPLDHVKDACVQQLMSQSADQMERHISMNARQNAWT